MVNFTGACSKLEKGVFSDITEVLRKIDKNLAPNSLSHNKIGQVKDFASLVILSQTQGRSFFDVKGGDEHQKKLAEKEFKTIANNLISITKKS